MILAQDMDLLDYFAAKAMAEFVAQNTAGEWDQEDISAMSYVMAEAMIKERDRDYSKDD